MSCDVPIHHAVRSAVRACAHAVPTGGTLAEVPTSPASSADCTSVTQSDPGGAFRESGRAERLDELAQLPVWPLLLSLLGAEDDDRARQHRSEPLDELLLTKG